MVKVQMEVNVWEHSSTADAMGDGCFDTVAI